MLLKTVIHIFTPGELTKVKRLKQNMQRKTPNKFSDAASCFLHLPSVIFVIKTLSLSMLLILWFTNGNLWL
jgi:hypothetical protein